MTSIVKVSCFPNEGTPVVVDGDPAAGDIVRITTNTGAVVYQRFSPPPAQVKAPDTQSFRGVVRARAKLLAKAGKHSESISLLKTIGE